MPLFRFKALTAGGELFEGEMEARDPLMVSRKLHDLGHTPIRAETIAPQRPGALRLGSGRRLSRKALAAFTAELAALLEAGLLLERALELIARGTGDRAQRAVTKALLQDIRAGASLSQALENRGRVFPRDYLGLVRAGEEGGSLGQVLTRLATHLERSQAIAEEVSSALVYPLLLIVMSGLAITVMMTLVVPEFEPLFEESGVPLPPITQMVIASSRWLGGNWWLLLLAGLGCLALFRRLMARPDFRLAWDRFVLRLPLFGSLQVKIQVASLTRTLGTLLGNGVSLLPALEILKGGLGNAAYRQSIDVVAGNLREGRSLARLLQESGLFPDLAVELVNVGEEAGQLDGMLIRLAETLDREVQITIKRLLALLVPGLTILLGALIAVIIASVLIALLSIHQLAL